MTIYLTFYMTRRSDNISLTCHPMLCAKEFTGSKDFWNHQPKQGNGGTNCNEPEAIFWTGSMGVLV